MTYIPLEDIKKNIVDYLEKSINSNTFDFRNLSLISIIKNIKNVPENKIEKAIDELIDDGELLECQSDLKIYIPKNLENNTNLTMLKLGSPAKTFLFTYFSGLFAILLSIALISYLKAFILSFDFSNPYNVIGNSVALGAVLPYGVGWILLNLYIVISKPLSNRGINKGALITIISCAIIFLIIYMGLAYYLQKPFESIFIMGSLTLGLTFGGLFYSLVLRKPSEGVKFN